MLVSTLALALLLAPILGAADGGASGYQPPADPGPNPACPEDMRLVVGAHDDDMERLCLRIKNDRCWIYVPHAVATEGERLTMRFCMDPYEAPNRRGARPIVMKDFHQATRWCEERGKRLCSEQEFETACEGPQLLPYFYGWEVDRRTCNSDKAWRAFDAKALYSGGEESRREVERLWQGTPSGEKDRCRTRDGIYDLLGNVEEWVTSRRGRRWPGALMGGFWAKPWTGCRGTNDAHESTFTFYEVGFRCCRAPIATP
jgi:hypothetical protein